MQQLRQRAIGEQLAARLTPSAIVRLVVGVHDALHLAVADEVTFERDDDTLAQALDADDPLAFNAAERRQRCAQQKRAPRFRVSPRAFASRLSA